MNRTAQSMALATFALLAVGPVLAQSQTPSGEAAQGEVGPGGLSELSHTSDDAKKGGAARIGVDSSSEPATSEIGKPEPLAGTTHAGH